MPVDPGIGTTHLCHRISECVLVTGTRSAESIMASGHGVPHQQSGHMAAPTSLASPSKITKGPQLAPTQTLPGRGHFLRHRRRTPRPPLP